MSNIIDVACHEKLPPPPECMETSTEEERRIDRDSPIYHPTVVAQIISSDKDFKLSKQAMKDVVNNPDWGEEVVFNTMHENFCKSPLKAKYLNSSWCIFHTKWAPSDGYILNPNEESDYYCKFFIKGKSIVLNIISFHLPKFSNY